MYLLFHSFYTNDNYQNFFENFDFLLLHTANFDNNIVLPFSVFNTFGFTFSVFFYTSNNISTCFIMACVFFYKKFVIDLVPTSFLLDFCFKNLDFSATHLAHFDVCLTTLFVLIIFLIPISQYYLYVFHNLKNKFTCFIMMTTFS